MSDQKQSVHISLKSLSSEALGATKIKVTWHPFFPQLGSTVPLDRTHSASPRCPVECDTR
jgi:hypothetical protein